MRLPPTALALLLTAAAVPRAALAASPGGEGAAGEAPPADPLAALRAPPSLTYQIFGSLFFGDGFRFNNPYRLKTQLGESAKTVSVTAPYVDFGIGFTLGNGLGLQHGIALDMSVALSGVGQAVLSPAYLATYRSRSGRFLGYGRLGPALILSPDANFGAELAAGAAVFVTAELAFTAQVVGDLFYGAATREVGYPVYPIVSLQLGLLYDREVLP